MTQQQTIKTTVQIIPFPVTTIKYFVEGSFWFNHHDYDTIMLEACTLDSANDEADRIAETYGWDQWVVYPIKQ